MPRYIGEFNPTTTDTFNMLIDIEEGGKLRLWNESNRTLKFATTFGDEYISVAWEEQIFHFDSMAVTQLDWVKLFDIEGDAPVNPRIYGMVYGHSEQVEDRTIFLHRYVGINNTVATTTPLQPLDIDVTDALTNTQLTILQSEHRSTGTPTTGFGSGWYMYAEDNAHLLQFMFRIRVFWLVATSGAQTARATIDIGDFATLREIIRLESTGSAGAIGFLGHAATVKPAALVQTYATATRTLTAYTPNNQSVAYTGQDNAQAGTVYAKVADLNTLRVAYENLRTQFETLMQFVNAFVDDMQSYGLE